MLIANHITKASYMYEDTCIFVASNQIEGRPYDSAKQEWSVTQIWEHLAEMEVCVMAASKCP